MNLINEVTPDPVNQEKELQSYGVYFDPEGKTLAQRVAELEKEVKNLRESMELFQRYMEVNNQIIENITKLTNIL